MAGKWTYVGLVTALVAFGYLFVMNPQQHTFQIMPGMEMQTSFALICFLFFITGFALAHFLFAFSEGVRSIRFWLHKKGVERHAEADELLDKGRGLAAGGKQRAARRFFRRASRKDPGRSRIQLELARTEIADEKYEAAQKKLSTLIESDPNNPEILTAQLDLYRRKNDFEGQVAALTRWLDLDPRHIPSLKSLRDLYYGHGHLGDAIRIQERILSGSLDRSERTTEASALLTLKVAHCRTMDNLLAQRELEKVIKRDAYAPAFAELARRYVQTGDATRADEVLQRGFGQTGQLGLLTKLERLKVERGQSEQLLKLYKKLSKKHPSVALLRARLLLQLSRGEEAIEVLNTCGEGVRRSAAAMALAGQAQFALGRFEKSAEAFNKGLSVRSLPTFVCKVCHEGQSQWTAVCPACKSEDSLEMDISTVAGRKS